MKTFVTILSALALMGAVSAASATPDTEKFGSQEWWQQFSDNN